MTAQGVVLAWPYELLVAPVPASGLWLVTFVHSGSLHNDKQLVWKLAEVGFVCGDPHPLRRRSPPQLGGSDPSGTVSPLGRGVRTTSFSFQQSVSGRPRRYQQEGAVGVPGSPTGLELIAPSCSKRQLRDITQGMGYWSDPDLFSLVSSSLHAQRKRLALLRHSSVLPPWDVHQVLVLPDSVVKRVGVGLPSGVQIVPGPVAGSDDASPLWQGVHGTHVAEFLALRADDVDVLDRTTAFDPRNSLSSAAAVIASTASFLFPDGLDGATYLAEGPPLQKHKYGMAVLRVWRSRKFVLRPHIVGGGSLFCRSKKDSQRRRLIWHDAEMSTGCRRAPRAAACSRCLPPVAHRGGTPCRRWQWRSEQCLLRQDGVVLDVPRRLCAGWFCMVLNQNSLAALWSYPLGGGEPRFKGKGTAPR